MRHGNPKGMKYKARNTAYPSFKQIGEAFGMSAGTAFSLYRRGIRKLEKAGALEGLLCCVQAVAMNERELLSAGSAECNKEFCALHSGEL